MCIIDAYEGKFILGGSETQVTRSRPQRERNKLIRGKLDFTIFRLHCGMISVSSPSLCVSTSLHVTEDTDQLHHPFCNKLLMLTARYVSKRISNFLES